MVEISPALAHNAVGVWGDQGRRWLHDLPRIVDEVVRGWSLRLGQPLTTSFHWVAAVSRDDGTPAVLKLTPPASEHQQSEAAALTAWAGRGAVRLLGYDPERGALLLQRAQPCRMLRDFVPARDPVATTVLAGVMRELHSVPPPAQGVPPLRNVRTSFERHLRARAGEAPLPRRLVEHALSLFDDLLGEDGPHVLLHGDLHHDNVLGDDTTPGGWLAIDPHGWVGPRGFDVGAMLYNPDPYQCSDELLGLVPQRIDQLADELAMPHDRVVAWGLVMAVLSQVWSVEDGDPVGGRPLDVALLLDHQLP